MTDRMGPGIGFRMASRARRARSSPSRSAALARNLAWMSSAEISRERPVRGSRAGEEHHGGDGGEEGWVHDLTQRRPCVALVQDEDAGLGTVENLNVLDIQQLKVGGRGVG